MSVRFGYFLPVVRVRAKRGGTARRATAPESPMNERLGVLFEREIREQPSIWSRLARTDAAARLAGSLEGDIVLVGSGSSLFVAQLGALALRRRRINAQALAATEARLDRNAYRNRTVVAVSQSGRSADLLQAIDELAPARLIALTNTAPSPLCERADVTIELDAGAERAVPASKSVSSSALLLLWAASLAARDGHRDGDALERTAEAIDAWLDGGENTLGPLERAAARIARRASLVVLGSDYGFPIASEAALKCKEACYLHAEGFAAGEFRHGSIAMVDANTAAIGIVDDDALAIVARPLREIEASGALRYVIGGPHVAGVERLGPHVETPFNTLAWLVTIQMLALLIARARGIDSDAPRGLTKALVQTDV
jgi:glucosamine--fructose-6-phosphate aminotransferase (isomerizing)